MSGVPKEKQAEEGIKICVEMIQQLKEIKGVRGVHIMAIEWEQKVAEIAKAAGLLPRPYRRKTASGIPSHEIHELPKFS